MTEILSMIGALLWAGLLSMMFLAALFILSMLKEIH